MDFSETVVFYDIKVGRCSQLNKYMKLYEYQRSRSFIDLEAKFYMEPPKDGGMKVNINGICNMYKMAAMPIYGKKHLQSFFSGTKRLMTLKLGMWHSLLEHYQICSNDDLGLKVTYFTTRSNFSPFCFCMRKWLSCRFPRNYWSLWGESWYI